MVEFYCTRGCESFERCKINPFAPVIRCVYAYNALDYKPEYRWKGEGNPSRRWTALDGTIVYRCYADSCD